MILSAGIAVVGLLLIAGGMLQRRGSYENGFVTILNDFQDMPHTMKQLAWVQFFSWFAPLRHVDLHHRGGHQPRLRHHRHDLGAVQRGRQLGGGRLRRLQRRRRAWWPSASRSWRGGPAARWRTRSAWSAARSGCSRSSSFTDPRFLLGSMVGVGIAWASILAMPYAILTGSLPPSKMGYYMGVFNFFIVIPQIVAAALLGFIVGRFFGGQAIYALAIGGGLVPARRGAHPAGRGPGRRGGRGMARRAAVLGLIAPRLVLAGCGAARPGAGRARVRAGPTPSPASVLEQRHDLLPPHRPLPERRPRQRPRPGPCARRRGAAQLRGWRSRRRAAADRAGLLRQPRA